MVAQRLAGAKPRGHREKSACGRGADAFHGASRPARALAASRFDGAARGAAVLPGR